MRPLSPYLSIYKPQIGSIFSIYGRITGVILTIVLLLFLCIDFLKVDFLSFYFFYTLYFSIWKGSSFFVLGNLFFFVLLFCYHIFFSLRYLYWSWTGGLGRLLSLTLEEMYGYVTKGIVVCLFVSLFVWIFII